MELSVGESFRASCRDATVPGDTALVCLEHRITAVSTFLMHCGLYKELCGLMTQIKLHVLQILLRLKTSVILLRLFPHVDVKRDKEYPEELRRAFERAQCHRFYAPGFKTTSQVLI